MSENLARVILAISIIFARPGKSGMAQVTSPQYSAQVQQVIQFMRERKHAYEKRDAAAWGRHVPEKCSFVRSG